MPLTCFIFHLQNNSRQYLCGQDITGYFPPARIRLGNGYMEIGYPPKIRPNWVGITR
ncbi:hypothetical protein LINPERHAP2_LOCUS7942 [Linum perenne]